MEPVNLNQSLKAVFNVMKFTFGIVPIVAGFDKFTELLTHWENYLHPGIPATLCSAYIYDDCRSY